MLHLLLMELSTEVVDNSVCKLCGVSLSRVADWIIYGSLTNVLKNIINKNKCLYYFHRCDV